MKKRFEAEKPESADRRTEKRKTGDAGERMSCAYLSEHGYEVLAKNYRCRAGEIDIVALEISSGTVCFVEVKTRSGTDYGLPCQAVDRSKQRRLKRCAEHYLVSGGFRAYPPVRMDIIEILLREDGVYLRHLRNAF